MIRTGLIILSICACQFASGSGESNERIQAVSQEISNEPGNPALYVERANLYLKNGDLNQSISDLETANQLAGKDILASLICRAEIELLLGNNSAALEYIDRFLDVKQVHVPAFRIKVEILERMGDLPSAIDYHKKILIHAKNPSPENYMALIDDLLKEDRETEAIFYCNQAIRRFGIEKGFRLKKEDIVLVSGNQGN